VIVTRAQRDVAMNARPSLENIVSRVSDLIGRTPLFQLGATDDGSRLLLKLEQFNPTGSTKVRMAEQMVTEAEQQGRLRAGGHIVEPTSGNTGLGLALIAIERGYRFTAIVDHHACVDKIRAMTALGAELIYVGEPGSSGPQTVQRRQVAQRLAATGGAFWADQHNNPGNGAGYRTLAHELLADVFGDVDYLISAIGTGGSLCGTVRELRALGSRVTSVGVEPAGSIIFDGAAGPYWQTGGGSPAGFPVGSNVDRSLIDEGVQVGDREAFATARVLARRTGLLVGGSSGGAVYAALCRLAALPEGSTVVSLVCDAGEKYLDTVFNDEWMGARDLLHPELERDIGQLLDRLQRLPTPRPAPEQTRAPL
jgi:cystathionine beta-synthase